ncbi:MAG TPA: HAMP domain-containing sensor histidine kinase [Aggregicoccus sp.]|nr:HAMP domain-containing sensor histidine kinase [Aggregicoccus sp.]
MQRQALSLRRLMAIAMVGLLALTLLVSVTPLLVTRQLSRISHSLGQTLEVLGTTEEVEVSALLHERELGLLQATGRAEHARLAAHALSELRRWLAQLPEQGASAQQTQALQALRRSARDYVAHAQEGAASTALQAALSRVVVEAEQLSALAFREMQATRLDAQRWRTLANALGMGSGLLLVAGLATLLWAAHRQLLRPLERFRDALAGFSATAPPRHVPHGGFAELRAISGTFNDLADRLARAREAQLQFLSGVAHDLRTPLTALKASAQLMHPSRPLPPEDKVREKFALVGRQVERLTRMVEDLLDTTRTEAGKLQLQVQAQDLGALVTEAVALHCDVSERHTLQLQLPPTPLQVPCDATRISQVLNNLLSNAIKYSPAGGVVQVTVAQEAGWARVSVQDPGVGIPAGEHASIFEPFRRASTSRESIPGVGLGLSVSRRIALAHGGSIRLHSAPGEGATFHLHLPLQPRPAPGPGAEPGAGPAPASEPRSGA